MADCCQTTDRSRESVVGVGAAGAEAVASVVDTKVVDENVPDLRPRGPLRALAGWFMAGLGVVLGLVPHVLHHVGLIAGTALLAGAAGTSLLGVVGLVASVPMLLRLHRRFGSWWAPLIGTAVFTVLFLVSALLVGPAITDSSDAPPRAPSPTPSDSEHAGHHG